MPAAKGTITRAEDGYTNWQAKHFVRAAAIDPDARKFPFDLDLEARLMGQVASHEMGHNLGLKDGSYGKGVFTGAQERDRRSEGGGVGKGCESTFRSGGWRYHKKKK